MSVSVSHYVVVYKVCLVMKTPEKQPQDPVADVGNEDELQHKCAPQMAAEILFE